MNKQRIVKIAALLLVNHALILGCSTNLEQKNKPNPLSLTTPQIPKIHVDCQKALPECPEQDYPLPTMCSAYLKGDKGPQPMLKGWGASLCEATRDLELRVCKNRSSSAELNISCGPDPSEGECANIKTPSCHEDPGTIVSCSVASYGDNPIPIVQLPKVWAGTECEARKKITIALCQQNLKPSLVSKIICENDLTEKECPIPPPDCEEQTQPTYCQVDVYGELQLKPPWTAYALSECRARYLIKSMACKFANSDNQLKPSLLGDISCRPTE